MTPYSFLLDVIGTTVGAATKASFDYDHDALGRRTQVVQTGEMFARYDGAGLFTKWSYNDRNEVMTAQTYNGTDPLDTSSPLAGRNFAYTYDNLGNRKTASVDALEASYTPDSLNQYSQRAVPGTARVAGLAPAAASVTVNGSATGVARQGDYYFQSLAMANTAGPAAQTVTIDSSYGGSTARPVFLPKTPEAFSYDADGNLIRDGRWVYQYDAENRPVKMFTRGAPEDANASDAANVAVWNSGVARQRIDFTYDYLGRRVRKTVLNRNTADTAWDTASDTKFIYDGWNLIAEYAVSSGGALSLARSHTWGLDWSGDRQGAGGVGGLLQTTNYAGGSARYLPAYDGNGNVAAMINQADGSLAAAFEYSAFGELLRATGSAAERCSFRFSTKYTDGETGLVYYGRRYYSPSLGRFINRDPIEETGGINLHAFVGNNGVNQWDYLGMYWIESGERCYSTGFWYDDDYYSSEETCYPILEWVPDDDPYNGEDNTGTGGTGSGTGGTGNTGGEKTDDTKKSEDSNNVENPDCAGLRQRMATATAIYEKHHSFFQPSGQYYAFSDAVGAYDSATMAATAGGLGTAAYALHAGRLPTQTSQLLPMGAESFRNVVGEARIAGRVAAGVGAIGLAADAVNLGNAIADGDSAGIWLNGGNVAYGSAAFLVAPPLGVAIAGAQLLVNGSLYAYQSRQDSINRTNTIQSAQSSLNTMATAGRVGTEIAAEMAERYEPGTSVTDCPGTWVTLSGYVLEPNNHHG